MCSFILYVFVVVVVVFKLQKHGIAIPSLRPPPPSAEKECVHPLEDVQAVDDQEELRPPVVSAAMCLPANSGKRWGMDEESIISKQSQVTHQVAYKEYVQDCRKRKLPSRKFVAFKRKRLRLMARSKQKRGEKRNERDERKRRKCCAVAMSDISVCECT